MTRITTLAAAVSVALLLSACGTPSSPIPTVTVTVTETVRTEVTTAPPPPTTPASMTPSPTPSPVSGHTGMVWHSQVDASRINQPAGTQPTFDGGDGITARIELLAFVDSEGPGSLGDECAEAIQFEGTADTHCLYVQWSFDVPSDYPADDAGFSTGPLLTPEGRQIELAWGADGVPGAKNVGFSTYYAGGTPGSTLRWNMGSNETEWRTLKYEVPPADKFLPLTFS